MTEIKLTKRYPQSRTEDIVDAYMRGWNDALDAVQNGKFIINDDRKTENCSEKPNNYKPQICDFCRYYNSNIPCGTTPSACKKADKFAEEFVQGLKNLQMVAKTEPQTERSEK